MKKLIISTIIGILTLSIVSAGFFSFFSSDSTNTSSSPAFNISNDFTTKVTSIDSLSTGSVSGGNKGGAGADLGGLLLDISNSNDFYQNSQGVIRFKHG